MIRDYIIDTLNMPLSIIEGQFKWGILASQDCDIRANYDLIFYPLKVTKKFSEWNQNINYFIEKAIKEPTRKFYLPQLRLPKKGRVLGPFQVIFQKPFIVPFNVINQIEVKSKLSLYLI